MSLDWDDGESCCCRKRANVVLTFRLRPCETLPSRSGEHTFASHYCREGQHKQKDTFITLHVTEETGPTEKEKTHPNSDFEITLPNILSISHSTTWQMAPVICTQRTLGSVSSIKESTKKKKRTRAHQSKYARKQTISKRQ